MSVVDINKVKDNFSRLVGTDFTKIVKQINTLKTRIDALNEEAAMKGTTNTKISDDLAKANTELNELKKEKVAIEQKLAECKEDLKHFTSQNDKITDALKEIDKINLDGGRRRRRRRSKRSKRSKKIKKSKRRNRY